ncbi:MAG: glutathione synthase [Hydrogenophilus sp.]|nr:glutathione synthase [Hydrogenophilus sp.]
MELAFLIDPLPTLNPQKDSSLLMMRSAARRGHTIWAIGPDALRWDGTRVVARAQRLSPHPPAEPVGWATVDAADLPLTAFAAVLLRYDPPFDFEYLARTWLLERATAAGARIYNDPRAVRDHSEKLALLEFPHLTPPTRVAASIADVQRAIDEVGGDAIVKPLDRMGGSGIFRVQRGDPNRNAIVEMLTEGGRRLVMVQRFLPEVVSGDKRVLLLAGKVFPWALARYPQAGETRANLAAGGRGVAEPLTPRERAIAEELAPLLWKRGLLLVGLDLIGGWLTEINVTSPTCLVELEAQTGLNAADWLLDALEQPAALSG